MSVKLVGRLANIRDSKAQFSGLLRNLCAMSDLKMNLCPSCPRIRTRSRPASPEAFRHTRLRLSGQGS